MNDLLLTKEPFEGYMKCPTLKVGWLKCNLVGHFMRRGKTIGNKKKSGNCTTSSRNERFRSNLSKMHCIEDMENPQLNSEEDKLELDSCFKWENNDMKCEEIGINMKCKISGQILNMIIDSGCKCNLISMKGWTSLENLN